MLIFTLGDLFMSVFGGVAVFSTLGFMAKRLDKDVDDVVESGEQIDLNVHWVLERKWWLYAFSYLMFPALVPDSLLGTRCPEMRDRTFLVEPGAARCSLQVFSSSRESEIRTRSLPSFLNLILGRSYWNENRNWDPLDNNRAYIIIPAQTFVTYMHYMSIILLSVP